MSRYLGEFLLHLGFFVIIVIAIIIAELLDKKHEKNMDADYFVVRRSILFLWKWLALTFTFIVLIALMRLSQNLGNDTVHWSMYLTCSAGALFSIGMIADYLRWQARVNGQYIYHRSLLASKTFTFNEIIKAKIDEQQNCVLLGSGDKELLSISRTSRGYAMLLSCLEQKGIAVNSLPKKHES